MKKTFYSELAENIISELKKGVIPWRKPWGDSGLPYNPVTGSRYRGNNLLALLLKNTDDPRWLTYQQARKLGAFVRKGEKGTVLTFWRFEEERPVLDENGRELVDENGKPRMELVKLERPISMNFVVFNGKQIEGLEPLQKKTIDWEPNLRAEEILARSGAKISYRQGDSAFYDFKSDEIVLPNKEQFAQQEDFYATALHELGHWTGHQSRLDRDMSNPIGSLGYAKEELRAEIASMILNAEIGIATDRSNHLSYLESYIKVLENDPTEIFKAAADAEKIQNYLLQYQNTQNLEVSEKIMPDFTLHQKIILQIENNELEIENLDVEERIQYQKACDDILYFSKNNPLWQTQPLPKNMEFFDSVYKIQQRLEALIFEENSKYVEELEKPEAKKPEADVADVADSEERRNFEEIINLEDKEFLEPEEQRRLEELREIEAFRKIEREIEYYKFLEEIGEEPLAVIEETPEASEARWRDMMAAAENEKQRLINKFFKTPSDRESREREIIEMIESNTFKDSFFNSMLEDDRDSLEMYLMMLEDITTNRKPVLQLEKSTRKNIKKFLKNAAEAKDFANKGLVLVKFVIITESKFQNRLREEENISAISSDAGIDKNISAVEANAIANTKIFIDVPYAEKDDARVLGAKWDRNVQSWYIPKGLNTELFSKWMKDNYKNNQVNPNFNQDRIYLAVPYADKEKVKAMGGIWDKAKKSWYVLAENAEFKAGKLDGWLPENQTTTVAPAMAPREEFAQKLLEMGCILEGKHPIMDGQSHRIKTLGDKGSEQSGFYRAYLDGHPAGYIKDHRTGNELKWKSKGYSLTAEEKAKLQAEAAQKKSERERERVQIQLDAAKRIKLNMEQHYKEINSQQLTPYLVQKGLNAHKGIFTDDKKLTTFIPAYSAEGELRSMQYINADGSKRFAKNAQQEGCLHVVGQKNLSEAETIIIAEGYATAASIEEVTDETVACVVAFNSGNLPRVASSLHALYSNKRFIIAGDDDMVLAEKNGINVGRQKAIEAAKILDCPAVFPIFSNSDNKDYTDFNDLANKSVFGKKGVEKQINDQIILLKNKENILKTQNRANKFDKPNVINQSRKLNV